MQQLLNISQGAAETLQEAVLRLMGAAGDSTAAAAAARTGSKKRAAAAAAAAAVVDARDVDAAEASPVSSDDES